MTVAFLKKKEADTNGQDKVKELVPTKIILIVNNLELHIKTPHDVPERRRNVWTDLEVKRKRIALVTDKGHRRDTKMG
jgi:hypothetical protein